MKKIALLSGTFLLLCFPSFGSQNDIDRFVHFVTYHLATEEGKKPDYWERNAQEVSFLAVSESVEQMNAYFEKNADFVRYHPDRLRYTYKSLLLLWVIVLKGNEVPKQLQGQLRQTLWKLGVSIPSEQEQERERHSFIRAFIDSLLLPLIKYEKNILEEITHSKPQLPLESVPPGVTGLSHLATAFEKLQVQSLYLKVVPSMSTFAFALGLFTAALLPLSPLSDNAMIRSWTFTQILAAEGIVTWVTYLFFRLSGRSWTEESEFYEIEKFGQALIQRLKEHNCVEELG